MLMELLTRKGEKLFIQVWTVSAPNSAQLNRDPRSWACGSERQLIERQRKRHTSGAVLERIDQMRF